MYLMNKNKKRVLVAQHSLNLTLSKRHEYSLLTSVHHEKRFVKR